MKDSNPLQSSLQALLDAGKEEKSKLDRRVDNITRARQYISSGFGELRRELSLLPNSAPDLVPDHAVEWHAALRVLEDLLSVANSAWQSADHHIASHIHNLSKDAEKINE